jgi:hypothetical protein
MYMTKTGMQDDSAHQEQAQNAEWEKHEAARVKAQKAK